jgi:nitrate/nitrite transport system substrate-binding protein
MVGGDVDYRGIVDRVNRPDLYRAVAKDLGIAAPAEDVKAETLFDGVRFDPAEPERYATGFAVHNVVA